MIDDTPETFVIMPDCRHRKAHLYICLVVAAVKLKQVVASDGVSYHLENATTMAYTFGDPDGVIMPPGCSCMESGVPDSKCDAFDCTCLCDLTAGSCDLDCCCDSECTENQTEAFRTCLDDGRADPVLRMCYEIDSTLEEINPSYPMRVSDNPQSALQGLICVETDNSAVKGNFFTDPGYPEPDFDFPYHDRLGPKQTDFSNQNDDFLRDEEEVFTYRLGDSIHLSGGNSSGIDVQFRSYMNIPSAGDGGFCTSHSTIAFGRNEKSSCLRPVVVHDIASDCTGSLSIDRYTHDLSVTALPITVDGYEDASGDAALSSGTVWDATASVCRNALAGVSYRFWYDTGGNIVNVTASVSIRDVPSTEEVVRQSFAVDFSATYAHMVKREAGQNNLVPRTRSGNPGYIFGLPTLGARSHNETVYYVDAQTAGLTIMKAAKTGDCTASDQSGTVVIFGEDMAIGCVVSLKRNELEEFCTSGNNDIPAWLASDQDLVGIFGNADPLDRSQWIKIVGNADPFEVDWLPSLGLCQGIPSLLHFQFLWTYVGSVDNPQAKIISARKTYKQSPLLRHIHRPDEAQTFRFETIVSWAFVRQENMVVKPPPPKLILSLPHDAFYPFDSSVGGVKRPSVLSPWMSIILVLSTARWAF